MDVPVTFLLPSPNFGRSPKNERKNNLNFLTPLGMTLLSRDNQPPPMYGPRGSTVSGKFLKKQIQSTTNVTIERKFCEPCNMEFQSERDFNWHCAAHEPCPVESCEFRGHSLVMDKHVMNFHASGLFDKVKNIQTPEDIAAWREERRKKYPSVVNTLQRQALQEQKQKRGERLEPIKSRFGERNQRKHTSATDKQLSKVKQKTHTKFKKTHKQNRNTFEHNPNKTNIEKCKISNEPKDSADDCLPKFRGTMNMPDYAHTSGVTVNKLAQLLAAYTSDDEDIQSDNEEMPHDYEQKPSEDKPKYGLITHENSFYDEKANLSPSNEICSASSENEIQNSDCKGIKNGLIETTTKGLTLNVDDNALLSDEAPDELPIDRTEYKAEVKLTTEVSQISKNSSLGLKKPLKKKIQQKFGLDYSKLHKHRQHTMLEKLLETEIRHERNVLLQCVRFLVNNDFFGIGRKKPKTEDDIKKTITSEEISIIHNSTIETS